MKKQSLNAMTWALGMVCACAAWAPAQGIEQGDWLVRIGPTWVLPNDDSGQVTGIPGSEVGVDDAVTLGFTVGYMVTNNLGVELLGIWPANHDLEGEGTLSPLGDIGETDVLPPTLSLNYYFMPESRWRPHVGVGVNYTTFLDEDASSSLEGLSGLGGPTSVDIDDSWGLAGNVGLDYDVNEQFFLGANVWYVDIEADTTLKTRTGAGVVRRTVNVDIDPWVILVGGGFRF